MVGKRFPLSLRRKSFDIQEFEKLNKKPLSGTVGKDLGFWTTCFLGFQTLGAIYGINSGELIHNIRRYWDESTLRIYWVSSHESRWTHVSCSIFQNSTDPAPEDVVGSA